MRTSIGVTKVIIVSQHCFMQTSTINLLSSSAGRNITMQIGRVYNKMTRPYGEVSLFYYQIMLTKFLLKIYKKLISSSLLPIYRPFSVLSSAARISRRLTSSVIIRGIDKMSKLKNMSEIKVSSALSN